MTSWAGVVAPVAVVFWISTCGNSGAISVSSAASDLKGLRTRKAVDFFSARSATCLPLPDIPEARQKYTSKRSTEKLATSVALWSEKEIRLSSVFDGRSIWADKATTSKVTIPERRWPDSPQVPLRLGGAGHRMSSLITGQTAVRLTEGFSIPRTLEIEAA